MVGEYVWYVLEVVVLLVVREELVDAVFERPVDRDNIGLDEVVVVLDNGALDGLGVVIVEGDVDDVVLVPPVAVPVPVPDPEYSVDDVNDVWLLVVTLVFEVTMDSVTLDDGDSDDKALDEVVGAAEL